LGCGHSNSSDDTDFYSNYFTVYGTEEDIQSIGNGYPNAAIGFDVGLNREVL
jgi:hypothetical protein